MKQTPSSALLAESDSTRSRTNAELDETSRSELGQFMTPSVVAEFMASLFGNLGENIRLLDAGAGVGSLTAAFVNEMLGRRTRPVAIQATTYEIDPVMVSGLETMLATCKRTASQSECRFDGEVAGSDFVVDGAANLDAGLFASGNRREFDAAILNPPYRKIHSASNERLTLRQVGIETSNLYTAFVALALRLLRQGGELVAITPRSFCNGPYFRPFRDLLLTESAIQQVHVFESRNRAFRDDSVLQENVIFHLRKGARKSKVKLSTSGAPGEPVSVRVVDHGVVVDPKDPNAVIHLPLTDEDAADAAQMMRLPCSLAELGVTVSTGRVVDFRARDHLRQDPGSSTAPLIYPAHFSDGFVEWPKLEGRKPNAIMASDSTRSLLVPNETYVLTRRFSSKEERRRIVAAVYEPDRLPEGIDEVGIENHINYFHIEGRGLPKQLARGLAAYLNCSLADRYFRQFNGHTQVNATDLRSLRYPDRQTLQAMGKRIRKKFPKQDRIDEIVAASAFG